MRTLFAAHILQEIYSDEKCLTSSFNITYKTIAWLNYIFNENFRLPMRENFIHIYDILKEDDDFSPDDILEIFRYMPRDVYFFKESFYALIDEFTKTKNFDEIIELLTKCNKRIDSTMLNGFCNLLKTDEKFLWKYSRIFKNMTPIQQIRRIFELYVIRRQNYKDNSKKQHPPIVSLSLFSMRIFAMIVQKVYGIPIEDTLKIKEDFQDWKYTPLSLENNVGKEILQIYKNEGDMTTERFFNITSDDRLYWWDESFKFSSDCENMLTMFKQKYETLLSTKNDNNVSEINALKTIMQTLSRHEKIFAGVPFFKSVFYEILDHLNDKRYRVLIKFIKDFEKDIADDTPYHELEKNGLKDTLTYSPRINAGDSAIINQCF